MKTATARLKSVSPYSQSKHITAEKLPRESPKDYESRCWRERLHYDATGQVFIPPMAFKNCLSEAAKYMNIQIPGQGKATYTKHFESGVLVVDPLMLPVKKDGVDGIWLFLPSNGQRGGGTRVDKCMPIIHSWQGNVNFLIFDEIVTPEIFEKALIAAGRFIGIGFFRPRNNGYYGRFSVEDITWSE